MDWQAMEKSSKHPDHRSPPTDRAITPRTHHSYFDMRRPRQQGDRARDETVAPHGENSSAQRFQEIESPQSYSPGDFDLRMMEFMARLSKLENEEAQPVKITKRQIWAAVALGLGLAIAIRLTWPTFFE